MELSFLFQLKVVPGELQEWERITQPYAKMIAYRERFTFKMKSTTKQIAVCFLTNYASA